MINKLKVLSSNKNIMLYAKNSFWMLAEYGLRIVSGVLVGIYVARYLGPEKFGLLSYALAIVSVFTVVSRLGMDSILVRELSKYPEKRQEYMGTAFSLILLVSIVCVLILSVLVYFIEADLNTQFYIFIIAIGMMFQAAVVIDFNFQSQLKAKYSSIAKSIALGLIATIKIFLVWAQAELYMFAFAYTLELFFIAVALLIMHIIKKQPGFIGVFRLELVKPLLKSALPMILSSVAAILYTRIDQIMIKNILGTHELGIYSAATKIYDGWIIIPSVISISLLPAIVKIKKSSKESYTKNLIKLFTVLFWIGVFAALTSSIFGSWILSATFGEAFVEAHLALAIIMCSAPFTALGSVTVRYLTVERMENKIAIRTFVGLFVNVVFNSILIPFYGIEGAAIATLITIVFTNYLINYFDKELEHLVFVCNSAVFFLYLKIIK